MLSNLKQLSILTKIFNVHKGEWHKVSVSWILRFLLRSSFVIGWTLIVTLFVSYFGILNLPILFVVNGLFSIFGTFFYSHLIRKYSEEQLMIFSIFAGGVLLFLSLLFFPVSKFLFLFLVIFVESVFLVQLRIMLSSYSEKLFNPLESERTFPLIESADTVGGIVAGLIIISLSGFLEMQKFVYIWIILLFLLVPTVYYAEAYYEKICLLSKIVKKTVSPRSIISKIRFEFSKGGHRVFLKFLFLIVFLQWVLFNLLEFQYTAAVYNNISSVVLDSGAGFEHSFVHDLGALTIFFHFSALLIQLFLGSRIINSLGVISSMLLHPIVTILSLFGLIMNFNFTSAVLAKNNFTITSVINTNAYHSAYYAIGESIRNQTRELLEGIIRPLGAVFGTLILLFLKFFFNGLALTQSINLLMLIVAVTLFVFIYTEQKEYTHAALNDLLYSKNNVIRKNAIDILAQRGHKSALKLLLKVLQDEHEPVSIRVKVLNALAVKQDINSVNVILECFNSSNFAVREASIDSLFTFVKFKKQNKNVMFLRLKVVHRLKKLFKSSKNERLRLKIVNLMSQISSVAAIEFLVELLDKGSKNVKIVSIFCLGNYCDADLLELLRPYLKSRNLDYQINAAISFGRVKKYLPESSKLIFSFLKSFNSKKIALALFAIGELNLRKYTRECFSYLYSSDLNIRMNSAFALAKMGYYESTPILIELLFHSDKDIAKKVKRKLQNVDGKIYKNIDKIVRHIVYERISDFKEKMSNEKNNIQNLDLANLLTLKWLYTLAEEYDEVESIDTYLTYN